MINFDKIDYLCEANSFETMCLWKENKLSWKEDNSGWLITVGYIDKRPICVSIRTCVINKINVLFWMPTSELVDYKMISEWFDENCNPYSGGRKARTDSTNFNHVLQHKK